MAYEDDIFEGESVCPGCGLPQSQYFENKGFISKTGDLYCCRDCAEGHLCECSDRAQIRSA